MKTTESTRPRTLGDEVVGYRVAGRDGVIGKVKHVTYDKRCMVVRTGTPLFGRSHVVLALSVQSIDPAEEEIFLDLSREDVRGAPEYDSHLGFDEDCQSRAEAYYSAILLNRELERGSSGS